MLTHGSPVPPHKVQAPLLLLISLIKVDSFLPNREQVENGGCLYLTNHLYHKLINPMSGRKFIPIPLATRLYGASFYSIYEV